MTRITSEQLLEKILAWIIQVQGSKVEINASTPILSESILDSMNLLLLISHVEEEYGININEEDLIPENFETPGKIVTLLQKSLGNN